MKRLLSVLLVLVLSICLVACGGAGTNVTTTEQDSSGTSTEQYVRVNSIEELEELVDKDVTGIVSALEEEYNSLTEEITTYDQYVEKVDKVEAFYAKVNEETEKLCIRLREYSINYAELVVNSNMTNDEKEDAVEDIYDCIYDKAGDAVYDGIYDGVLEDMYDYFYDGVISDGYDYAPYKEWSDILSEEYDMWSDTLSDVYDSWSDALSDIYGFWSDVSGAMWDNDMEEIKTEIEKFKEDIKELKE